MNTINQTETAVKTDYNTYNTSDNLLNSNNNTNSSANVNKLFLPYLQNYNVGIIRGSESNGDNLNKVIRMNNSINLNIGNIK